VLAFDDQYRLRTANASAAVILQQPLADLTGMALPDWGRKLPALAPFAGLVAESFRGSRDGHWQKQAELAVANLTRVLLMRGSRLPVTPVAGYVVVFDDVTDLAQAQRNAAWGEVARRLAHEIKNPLTPIQLAAEHLDRVHQDRGQPLGPVVDQCVRTILGQVRLLRQIASEFSNFAGTPAVRLAVVPLEALLTEVVNPYRLGLASRIALEVDVPTSTPAVVAATSAARNRAERMRSMGVPQRVCGGPHHTITSGVERARQASPNAGKTRPRVRP
jgi:nitrogen fixation/metabolism regulation signal transduction histidine kinase